MVACRICLEAEPSEALIAPCNCAGSCAYVHRNCLDLWRRSLSRCSRSPRRAAVEYCSTCGFQFELEGESHAACAGLGPLGVLPALLRHSGREPGQARLLREQVVLALIDMALLAAVGADLLALAMMPSYLALSRQAALTLGCCAYACLLAMWLQEGFGRRRDGRLALAVHLPALCAAMGALARPPTSLASKVQELAGVFRVVPEMACLIVGALCVAEVREELRELVRGDDVDLPRIKCMRGAGPPRIKLESEPCAAGKAHGGGGESTGMAAAGLERAGLTARRIVAAA